MTSQFPTLRDTVARQMADYRQRLASRINTEMNSRSWTVDDLAYRSGVSEKTISRLLDAKHDPRKSTVRRLAEGLDLDPAVLSPQAESDQLQRLEEKLDEVLVLLRGDAQAETTKRLAEEAKAEVPQRDQRSRRKPRAASL